MGKVVLPSDGAFEPVKTMNDLMLSMNHTIHSYFRFSLVCKVIGELNLRSYFKIYAALVEKEIMTP